MKIAIGLAALALCRPGLAQAPPPAERMVIMISLDGFPGFALDGEQFSSLVCFEGRLADERVTLLFIDVTHYNETVAELISPTYLRGKFGIKDGDEVSFQAWDVLG
jgi:CTP-dependent riboflavin kinase